MSKREIPPLVQRALLYDQKITKTLVTYWLQFNTGNKLRKYCKFLEYSCNGIFWLVSWLAFVYIIDNAAHYAMQINMLVGLVLDIVFVAIMKAYFRRRRPTPCDDMMSIGPDIFSFPSGHASRAAFVFLFFTYLSPLGLIWWLPLTAWALGVCGSRLALQRHYLMDILGGIILGIIEALLMNLIWLSPQTASNIIGLMSNDGSTVEMEV